MLASEIWAKTNTLVRNFGSLKEQEGLEMINYAIGYMNDFLIGIGDKGMTKTLAVATGQLVPYDWSGKCAGQFPVTDEAGTFTVTKPFSSTSTIKYFARKPMINSMSDTIQFDDHTAIILPLIASICAINRAEGDTTNDERILQNRLEQLKAARGT
jgi:hypothetical protein